MNRPVGDPGTADEAVEPLDQDVKGICPEIGQQKQRDAEVGDRQSDKEDHHSENNFFS